MEKWRRSERIVVMTKILLESPHKLFTLGYFAQMFQAAKSSISEDLTIIKNTLQDIGQGRLETVSGAAGGVQYLPFVSTKEEQDILQSLSEKLSDPNRILPGGYIYMTDLIYDPSILNKLGHIFAHKFSEQKPDYIVTVETKGIPLALMTAKAFNVPLVIIRNDGRVTEGSAVSINYVSGSSKKIGSMSLARKALPSGSKVIIIDDFMKAGGTAKGVLDLMQEFKAEVLAIGVLIDTKEPETKVVKDYLGLLELDKLDEINKIIRVKIKNNNNI
ncbi:purine operon repressor, PurR [Desulfonispora thiosulfatigenes DSM 11270]|uniref:Purine operon repressor, PurR n=1 Tax=Desulfonispora thiosulfatigenes DSM 11270 TaxID=656914 RepID=A0A1W1UZP5_DESTI|nr:pur operon repressor [Desulfonispora thiosulfatigenes]SMB86553.1 purine operon repressor, PurR [Desulfonispora thiosulfatigenes DSM 11270]